MFPNNIIVSSFPKLPVVFAKPIFYDLAYDLIIGQKSVGKTEKKEKKWSFLGYFNK